MNAKPKTRESSIEKKITTEAKALGYEVFKFTSPARSGVPDRMFINQHGVTFFIEVKRPGQNPSPLQNREILRMSYRSRLLATWVDNVEEAIEFLKQRKDIEMGSKVAPGEAGYPYLEPA